MKNKIIIGVTGGIGSGKTTVCKIFKELGCVWIDTDSIAKKIINTKRIKEKLVNFFGKQILEDNKFISYSKLRKLAFKEKDKALELNRITHPMIRKKIKKMIDNTPIKEIVVDIPLLIEGESMLPLVDKIVVIKASEEVRKQRAAKKTYLDLEDIENIIKLQTTDQFKLNFADYIIDNNGSIEDLEKQVIQLWHKIKQ